MVEVGTEYFSHKQDADCFRRLNNHGRLKTRWQIMQKLMFKCLPWCALHTL